MMQKFNPVKTKHLKQINAVLSVFFHEKKADTPLCLKDAGTILVVEAGRIGDIIMSLPFYRTLRRNAPLAEITLVCGSWAETVLQGQGLADRFVCLDPQVIRTPLEMLKKHSQIRQALRRINDRYYDIALEPRGDLRDIFLMHWCHAGRKAAYSYTGGECFLTDVVNPPQKNMHLVQEKLYFARQLGCRIWKKDRYPQLELTKEQKAENEHFLKDCGFQGKQILGSHPGAGLGIKQWGGFQELIQRLCAVSGNRVFLIFEGPDEHEAAAQAAAAAQTCGAQAVVSRTGLGQYMQRLALCDAVFCNDSGAGHIARAYGVPVYVVFGPVSPAFARPYAKDQVYVFSDDSLPCKPCFLTKCPAGQECLRQIDARAVCSAYEAVSAHGPHRQRSGRIG